MIRVMPALFSAQSSEPEDTFFTDFGEYSANGLPSEWTNKWNDADWKVISDENYTGGKGLRDITETHNIRFAAWDKVGDDLKEVEGVGKFLIDVKSADDGTITGIVLRGDGDLNGYMTFIQTKEINFPHDPVLQLRSGKAEEGSFSEISIVDKYEDYEVGWYWIRFYIEGNELRARMWKEGEDERDEWDIVENDNSFSEGSAGIFNYQPEEYNTNDIDVIGFGLDGTRAPQE